MKSLIIYDSKTGNTEKVAQSIHETVMESSTDVEILKINSNIQIDILSYDLVFIGSPVIDWLPTQTMMQYVETATKKYAEQKQIKVSSPKIEGKFAVCFCTYGEPHIEEREAISATMWLCSFVDYLGFTTLGLWNIPGQFVNHPLAATLNIGGRLGNVMERPNGHDLKEIVARGKWLLKSIGECE